MSEDSSTPEEKLLSRHRTEKKDLQAKIQQLKKSVNNDKKKKKDILKEISAWEESLDCQHSAELKEFYSKKQINGDAKDPNVNTISEDLNNIEITQEKLHNGRKITKAEKRRQKKSEAEKARELLIQQELENSKFSARNIEAEKLKALLKERNFKMFEIEPDGNCMYAAISHQIRNVYSVSNLRAQAAAFMRKNSDDFAPFLMQPDTGNIMTPEEFEVYCHNVEHSNCWGGEPELKALSQCLKRKLEVLQAVGAPQFFGEEFTVEPIIVLPYYRHYYGLGEHYNSIVELIEKT